MIIGILLAYILVNTGAPSIIWVVYGMYWIAVIIRVLLSINEAFNRIKHE